MLTKIDIPTGYFPQVYVFERTEKPGHWRWKYKLPNGAWIYCAAGRDERRARKHAKLKERDLAQGLLTDRELRKMQETIGVGPLTIEGAVTEYLSKTGLKKTGHTKNGETAMIKATFRYFVKECALTHIHEVKFQHLDKFRFHLEERISNQEIKSISANNRLKNLKKVFNWLHHHKFILANPCAELEPIKVERSEKARSVTLTNDQFQRIVEAPYRCSSGFDVQGFLLCMYLTGLRPGEALHLEFSDLDLNKGELYIRNKPKCPTKFGIGWKPKWGKERTVPLCSKAVAFFRSIPRNFSVGYVAGHNEPVPAQFVFTTRDHKRSHDGVTAWRRIDDVRSTWKKLLETAGLSGQSLENHLGADAIDFVRHDVRRSWNAHAKYIGGNTVTERSALLGHTPDVNELHYGGEVEQSRLRQVVESHPSNHSPVVDLYLGTRRSD